MNAKQVRRVIMDAAEHVPFYRRHWKQAGVDLTRIYSSVPLEFLPVVTRADLLACAPEDRLDQRYLGQPLRGEPTSTRAGEQFEVPVDSRTRRRRRMRFWNALRDVGYIPGERLMIIADAPLSSAAALLRWTGADTSLGDDALFDKYSKTRPGVLCAPLSVLVAFASRLMGSGRDAWKPRIVISTTEHFTDAKGALIESTFGARVADFYSTPEHGLVAYSKPGITGYQLLTQEFHFESLHSAAGKAGPGRLIVTDLVTGAMPLIRFETGDSVLRDASRATLLSPAPVVAFASREPVRVDRKAKPAIPPQERERAVTGLAGSSLSDAFARGSI